MPRILPSTLPTTVGRSLPDVVCFLDALRVRVLRLRGRLRLLALAATFPVVQHPQPEADGTQLPHLERDSHWATDRPPQCTSRRKPRHHIGQFYWPDLAE